MNKIKISGFSLKSLLFLAGVFTSIIVFTTILFFYAQGKRFNDEGELVDTGTIRLYSTPDNVDAFINDVRFGISNNLIDGIEPGEVTLKLTKEGYSDWEKVLTIESNVVKDVYVQLFPMELNFIQLTNDNVDRIFFSKDPGFVFYTILESETPSNVGIWKLKLAKSTLDFTSTQPIQIVSFDQVVLDQLKNNDYSLKIANNNNSLILLSPKVNIAHIYETNRSTIPLDLAGVLGYYPDHVEWFQNSDSLVIQKDKLLFEYELSSTEMNLITYSDSLDNPIYSLSSDSVYFYDASDKMISQYKNRIVTSLKLSAFLSLPKKVTAIYSAYNTNDIIIIEGDGNLYFLNIDKLYYEQLDTNAKLVSFGDEGLKLTYLKEGTYYSCELEESLDRKSYAKQIKALNFSKENVQKFYYSSNNTNLIEFTKSSENTPELSISDFDGLNRRVIDTKNSIIGTTAQIALNGSEMYVLLENSSSTEIENSTRNIYKIDLKVK
jgi:hypothetical protein